MSNVYNVTYKLEPLIPLTPLYLNDVKFIVLHHIDYPYATYLDINTWHKDTNGWTCAGYNEYVRKDGSVYILRGDNVGAQEEGFNKISYGIAAEGNFNSEQDMSKAQFDAIVSRIVFNKARFRNYQATVPHKQLCNTTCPGQYFPINSIMNKVEVKSMPVEHWAQKPFDRLKVLGIDIKEMRFDDKITRGEAFALKVQMAEWVLKLLGR
jgi:hypothetical protein